LTITDTDGNNAAIYNFETSPGGLHSGTDTVNIQDAPIPNLSPVLYPASILFRQPCPTPAPPILSAYSIFIRRSGGDSCLPKDWTDFSFSFVITLQVGICNVQSIDNPECVLYCNSQEGLQPCFSDYQTYCLTPTIPSNPQSIRMDKEIICQDYIAQYIGNIGPVGSIDNTLEAFCNTSQGGKFRGFADLEMASTVDRNLCSCNMEQVQYENYVRDLFAAFPGYAAIPGVNDRCFYFPCASSAYKTQETGQVCPVPQCVDIVGIKNNGTFTGSRISINPQAGCARIVGGTGAGAPGAPGAPGSPGAPGAPGESGTDTRTFFEKYRWYIIGAGIAIIILIIVVIIIFATRGGGDNSSKKSSELTPEELALLT
jgi:hypothetical protein